MNDPIAPAAIAERPRASMVLAVGRREQREQRIRSSGSKYPAMVPGSQGKWDDKG